LALISPWQRERAKATARQRHETLRRVILLQKKHSLADAAGIVGVSIPTLWRWRKKFTARGLAGLEPKPGGGGRRSPFQKIRLPVVALRELERLIVARGSAAAGWRQFGSRPLCPPLVARHVAKTGRAPYRLANLVQVNQVPAVVYASLDGKRLYVRLATKMAGAAHCSAAGAFVFSFSHHEASRRGRGSVSNHGRQKPPFEFLQFQPTKNLCLIPPTI
jgi:transposase-like protein